MSFGHPASTVVPAFFLLGVMAGAIGCLLLVAWLVPQPKQLASREPVVMVSSLPSTEPVVSSEPQDSEWIQNKQSGECINLYNHVDAYIPYENIQAATKSLGFVIDRPPTIAPQGELVEVCRSLDEEMPYVLQLIAQPVGDQQIGGEWQVHYLPQL